MRSFRFDRAVERGADAVAAGFRFRTSVGKTGGVLRAFTATEADYS
jgi:hypothetical protein